VAKLAGFEHSTRTLLVIMWGVVLKSLVSAPFTLRPTVRLGWLPVLLGGHFALAVTAAIAVWFSRTGSTRSTWVWVILSTLALTFSLPRLARDFTGVTLWDVVGASIDVIGIAAGRMVIREQRA
jgi:hypothetical protein